VLPFHGRFGLTFPGLLARFFRPFLANFSRHFPLTISYTRLCYYNDDTDGHRSKHLDAAACFDLSAHVFDLPTFETREGKSQLQVGSGTQLEC
jgi:hypothetical protein